MDLRHPYLTEQLIAYIGNKRALLPFLHEVLVDLVPDASRATFLDPFAGTGAVSRLARLMGFDVAANDWEAYAYAINSCHLGMNASDLGPLFSRFGGMDAVLAELNALPPPDEDREYISRHYAPRNTATADWRTERLFYTRENALAIDAIRDRVEEMFPGALDSGPASPVKAALLAPLLYEAATHTNTSGVFKACHRGFGGHGADALSRIMAPIRMRRPRLIDAAKRGTVRCGEAQVFLRGRTADVCYLDPPYAVHQYGSNYFMLNSIALWDRPPVSAERGTDGRLLKKAGIRQDWTRTRSAFCHPATAAAPMRETLRCADCRWIVLSYSDEGVIGLEELCDILAAEGSLSVRSTGYVKYPGGKQSMKRTIRNQELAFVVDRRRAPRALPAGPLLAEVRLGRLLSGSYHPDRIRAAFPVVGDAIAPAGCGARLFMRHFWRFRDVSTVFPDSAGRESFLSALSECAVRDAREEIDVLVSIVEAEPDPRERRALQRQILTLLNRIAHRKYSRPFSETLGRLRSVPWLEGAEPFFRAGLQAAAVKAERRFAANTRSLPTPRSAP